MTLTPTPKVVLVTGGGDGIGRALVRGFAEQHARVVYVDLASQEPPPAGDVTFMKCDVSDRARVKQVPLIPHLVSDCRCTAD
jgi:NAD(P)-dependent dehydrogenase (short-subunit alcohol dehydrogenase family)